MSCKNKFIALLSLLLLLPCLIYGNTPSDLKDAGNIQKDTLYTEFLKDIVILSTIKETNSLRFLPASVSVFSQKNLEALQITSLKDLSAIVPNYFAANYGSRMTAPLYIRGVGARSGNQTVSMYVDNMPYFNTTSFDTELYDIQRVEVLRGTQGTLYGRNAMGGILNVYTYSPLDYQGTRASIGGGSYGLFNVNASHYSKLNDNMGIAVSGYYKRHDGYYRNEYNGQKIDDMDNGGFRVKYAWNIQPNLSMNLTTSLDLLNQGAFPYEDIELGKIDFNSDAYYKRKLSTNGLTFKYSGDGYEINSVTGYQYLNDDMNMDQDYTSKSYFQINQRQKQNSLSQEFTIKSSNTSNYQWSGGLYGFYDYLHTTPPVYMMEDGIQEHLLSNMSKGMMAGIMTNDKIPDRVKEMLKQIDYTSDETSLPLDGNFKQPTYGLAAFHQSTYNNLFTKGLSATVGLRLDYEKTKLDYHSYLQKGTMNMVLPPMLGGKSYPMSAASSVAGKVDKDFLELLPRFVTKYEVDHGTHFYLSASKGYKTGGHNIQGFADILQNAIQGQLMQELGRVMKELPMPPTVTVPIPQMPEMDVEKMITYKPEYSWNYEFGGEVSIIKNILTTNFSLFYVDIKDVQLTKFVAEMGGRSIVNGGKARSMGGELSMRVRPCNGFFLYGTYGFADAEFKDYKTTEKRKNETTGKMENVEVDYSGNKIPFAPRSTFSVGGTVEIDGKGKSFFDKITLDCNYAGVGKIYWNEANTQSQGFYGTVNAKLQIQKGIFTIEAWGKNILDRRYHAFQFSSGTDEKLRYYGQRALPATFGGALKIAF